MQITKIKPNLFFKCKEEKEFYKSAKNIIGKKIKQIPNIGLGYLQGIDILDQNGYVGNDNIFIFRHEKGTVFKILNIVQNTGYIFYITEKDVIRITFIDGEEVTQKKSVIGRSIAGALIAGPVGAVVGGLSGTGTNVKQGAYMVVETNEAKKIIFKLKPDTKLIFETKFKVIFKNKVITSLL